MAKNVTTTNTAKANIIATLMKELNPDEIAALAKLGNGASTDEVFAACPTLATKLMKNPEIIKGLAAAVDAEAAEDEDDGNAEDTNLQIALLKKENAKLRKQAAKKAKKNQKDDDEDDDDEDEDDDALFKVKIADDWSWNRVGEIVLGGAIVSVLTIGAVYAINALSEK